MLELVKAKLGISSTVRDAVLTSIIGGVTKDFSDIYGLDVTNYQDLASDLVVFRYKGRDSEGEIPKHIHRRIREAQLGTVLKASETITAE